MEGVASPEISPSSSSVALVDAACFLLDGLKYDRCQPLRAPIPGLSVASFSFLR